MSVFNIVSDILKEMPVGAVLREKVLLLETEIGLLVERNAQLEKAKSDCLEQIRKIENELIEARKTIEKLTQWTYFRGVRFFKLPGGNYDEAVYCPNCHCVMSTPAGIGNCFYCEPCKFKSGVRVSELQRILTELKKRN